MRRLSLFFTLFFASLAAEEYSKIEAYLAINAPKDALKELAPKLSLEPDSQKLLALQITTLARMGEISSMLKVAKRLQNLDKALLEEMAWAVIRKASVSHSPFIRQEATLAAFMANDAKGIPLCLLAMQDTSEQARLLAYNLAARCPDDAVKYLSHQAITMDSSPRVRLQAIMTVGALRLEVAKDTLLALLEEKDVHPNEKIAAIQALTNIYNACDASLIQQLVKNERAQERALACYLVLMLQDKASLPHIVQLMNDPSFDVRLLAIQCVGVVGAESIKDLSLETLLSHQDIKTRILANWLILLKDGCTKEVEHNFQEFINQQDRTLRLYAASSIAHAGHHGLPLALYGMATSNDPFVRMNLAAGLIWQRVELEKACKTMLTAMIDPVRISQTRFGIFSLIGPTQARHMAGIARLPETEDLITRLELYSMISSCGICDIKEPLRAFLKDRTWGISGQTASLMMQEGVLVFDELRALLTDSNQEIALQAAFLLAAYSQDEEALKVLEKAYPTASRQMKEFILYAMGTIGAPSMLPFLVSVLNEPFESLRVIGARAILLSLYH